MTACPGPNVLLVADRAEGDAALTDAVRRRRARLHVVSDAEEALRRCEDRLWDLLIVDADGPCEWSDVVARARRNTPELPAIVLGPGGDDATLRLHRLDKPVDPEELASRLETLLPGHDVPLAAAADDAECGYRIAGVSEAFLETIRLGRKVAPTSIPVLITGESGTGKELVSRLIHRESRRSDGPFVHVNCATLSDSLLESELFGHEKGAFTGAIGLRKGRFERAHGGTLLLDEISETNERLQAELLRVMEQQQFERVGGGEPVRVNVRIVSTSNRDLAAGVEEGRFRRDLFHRISGIHLTVPALRHRSEDIVPLVWHFVNECAGETGRRITALDEGTVELFESYHWPGNVRELRNIVRSALTLGEGPTFTLEGLDVLRARLDRPASMETDTLQLRDLERQAILEALRRTRRNQAKAARLLGITDRTLREKLRRYRESGHYEPAEPAGETRWQAT